MNNYIVGTAVKLRMLFYQDAAKTTLADPTTVTLRVKAPSGAVTTHVYLTDGALVKASTGDYYENYTPTAAGDYDYEFDGSGTVDVVQRSKFHAERSLSQD